MAGSLNWPISVLSLPAASLAIQHKPHQKIRDTQLNYLITTCRNPLKARWLALVITRKRTRGPTLVLFAPRLKHNHHNFTSIHKLF